MIDYYIFDRDSRIWFRNGASKFPYSDGDEAEHYLLSVLKSAHDLSTSSTELISAIRDWPSEYHLSMVRHNLLRPFHFKSSDRILELGCGCGSISRYLGESGASVIAVEGSHRRAQIAAERCRDLSNVKIICDNIIDFTSDKTFDYVLLIGVLEYANLFIDTEDPVKACLEHARCFLKDDGSLILAIENQLGLKYFSGCAEDHTNIAFFGIHDLYSKNTAITFGKRELKSKLCSAGFNDVKFFYPFPDYKLPNIILTDKGADNINFQTADLLYKSIGRDYADKGYRAFYDTLAWQPIVRNGLLQDLANSFLVIAHRHASSSNETNWYARIYTAERQPCYATETILHPEDDTIVVTKRLLFPQTNTAYVFDGLHLRQQLLPHSRYFFGKLYVSELHFILASQGDISELATWAKLWIEHLESKTIETSIGRMLPGDWLDATPANFIRVNAEDLVLIDTEWQIEDTIPFNWVLVRGLFYAITTGPLSQKMSKMSFREILNQVLIYLGMPPLTDNDVKKAATLEDALQKDVYNSKTKTLNFEEIFELPLNFLIAHPTISEKNSELQREISRIKSTFSWRITKPLRFIDMLFRQVIKYLQK